MSEAAQRSIERREREDSAARLLSVVPTLESLRLEIAERNAGASVAETSHVRLIQVDNAPAMFLFGCGDSACRDGGHDLTEPILRALRSGQPRFEAEDDCRGAVGSSMCRRTLKCVGIVTYKS